MKWPLMFFERAVVAIFAVLQSIRRCLLLRGAWSVASPRSRRTRDTVRRPARIIWGGSPVRKHIDSPGNSSPGCPQLIFTGRTSKTTKVPRRSRCMACATNRHQMPHWRRDPWRRTTPIKVHTARFFRSLVACQIHRQRSYTALPAGPFYLANRCYGNVWRASKRHFLNARASASSRFTSWNLA